MDYQEYQRRVLARASRDWHSDKIDIATFEMVLNEFIFWGKQLDGVKKALFYGREFPAFVTGAPLMVEVGDRDAQLIHALLGFATEGVEMVEAIRAQLIEGKPFDEFNLQEEFGDGEWYRALGLDILEQTHESNLVQNDSKLEARYGPVFSQERALNRDLDTERKALEND